MANSRHCNIFGPTFGFKNHSNLNLRNKITKNNCHPHTNFYILTREKIPPPHTSPILAHSLLSDWLWAPLKEQMSDTASTDSLLHLLGSSNKITHTHQTKIPIRCNPKCFIEMPHVNTILQIAPASKECSPIVAVQTPQVKWAIELVWELSHPVSNRESQKNAQLVLESELRCINIKKSRLRISFDFLSFFLCDHIWPSN